VWRILHVCLRLTAAISEENGEPEMSNFLRSAQSRLNWAAGNTSSVVSPKIPFALRGMCMIIWHGLADGRWWERARREAKQDRGGGLPLQSLATEY
jgi:hypothetical protein